MSKGTAVKLRTTYTVARVREAGRLPAASPKKRWGSSLGTREARRDCFSGLMVINNLEQIYEAFGGTEGSVGVYVSILSIASCMGRLLIGLLLERSASLGSRSDWHAGAGPLAAPESAHGAHCPLWAAYLTRGACQSTGARP